uniref:Uncharacterized protein n=1 Tax=Rhizophora mucronata TaxID=61149 RepID=A0A2P2PPT1_RHIMU
MFQKLIGLIHITAKNSQRKMGMIQT